MTTYAEALSIILNSVERMPQESRSLTVSLGQVLAEDLRSPSTLPERAAAEPDGYALRACDLVGATQETPVTLRILEIVSAGHLPLHAIEPGTASRIMTGSTLPEGADCVVRFEDTDEPTAKNGPNPQQPTHVRIGIEVPSGTGVLPAGHIVRNGALVAPQGTVIGAAQISALCAIGQQRIPVYRRPVIGLLCTGDELATLGRPLPPGKVYNSNGPALAALVRHHGGIPKVLGIARDNRGTLETKLRKGMQYDAILTSGGVSKGDFDLVRLAIKAHGQVLFNRIAMGPGASFSFGVVKAIEENRTIPVFALAGPPAGCLINFETLVRPALRKMMGFTDLQHPVVEAAALDNATSRAPFPFVRYAQLRRSHEGFTVTFGAAAGPGNLASLAQGNALVILEKGQVINAGDRVCVLPFDEC